MNAVPGPRDLSALLVPVTGQLLVVPGAVVAEIRTRSADVQAVDAPAPGPAERMKVRVHGQDAAIPDFDFIEQHLAAP